MPGDFIDISVLGDKKLQRKLKKLDLKESKKMARQSLKEAAKPVKMKAQALAPVRTGLLRRKITIGTVSRKSFVSAVVRTGKRKSMGIPSYAEYYYPAIMEYGSRKRGISPRPYMKPALEIERPNVLNIFRKELRSRLMRKVR